MTATNVPVDQDRPASSPAAHTILLIEDDANILLLAQHVLQDQGFLVLCASEGRKGLDLFHHHQQAIVAAILDLSLPDMDGQEIYQELRKQRESLPIILMSGSQDPCWPPCGEKPTFLQKPFCIADLLASIQTVLGRKCF